MGDDGGRKPEKKLTFTGPGVERLRVMISEAKARELAV